MYFLQEWKSVKNNSNGIRSQNLSQVMLLWEKQMSVSKVYKSIIQHASS